MHFIELDQSGRTEKLNEHSIIAFSNDIHSSISLDARTKRAIYEALKSQTMKKPTPYIHLRVFSAAVFYLLRDHIRTISHITIDREFDGRDADLKAMLLRYIRSTVPRFSRESITIKSIGKKSAAHDLAHRVFLERARPDKRVKADELLRLLLPEKKYKAHFGESRLVT